MSDVPETSSNANTGNTNTGKPNTNTLLSLDDYLKGIMKLQHQSINQANVD
ncbi:hypothetical protein PGT21_027612 [Puccinia graminis f. sp. tritici]|uniref:Uncharacterized protein n=1 Tax=Puccinia graminis f. sp. tritici TaxID=56615 RepID=A0A5B0LZP6_PUCGR|nr:hypothetical protein PGT21_027612 [Puccinia graminis f. sp. tritici]